MCVWVSLQTYTLSQTFCRLFWSCRIVGYQDHSNLTSWQHRMEIKYTFPLNLNFARQRLNLLDVINV